MNFAGVIKHIRKANDWESVREFAELVDKYRTAFRELRLKESGITVTELIQSIRRRHIQVVPLLCAGVVKLKWPSVDERDQWTEYFLLSRVSAEVLMSHYVASQKASVTDARVGIVHKDADPWEVCREAAEELRKRRPACRICVESRIGKRRHFSHAPRYLFYIVQELLENSAKAQERQVDGVHPITLTVCSNEQKLMVRVSDRAGGLPFPNMEDAWWSLYRHSADPVDELVDDPSLGQSWGVFTGKSPIGGGRVGLHLCRLFTHFLGGDMQVMNMPGLGMDVYITLPRMVV